MLIMVDGSVLGEQFFEYINQQDEDWNDTEEAIDPAQWFFY